MTAMHWTNLAVTSLLATVSVAYRPGLDGVLQLPRAFKGKARAAASLHLCLTTLHSRCDLLHAPSADDMRNAGEVWALLVAGSRGWGNYRHQADVCHVSPFVHVGKSGFVYRSCIP